MDCEVLICSGTASRGSIMLAAMVAAAHQAGMNCLVDDQYRARSKWLMTYGLGHTERRKWVDAHLQNGGRLIGWDLGYWDRSQSMRLTIDADHPQRLLHDFGKERFERSALQLRNDYDAFGPIVLVGLGRKQRAALHDSTMRWESNKLKQIRAAYPDKQILYRPKRTENLRGVKSVSGSIEQVLKGASLIVCRHSNVAVDACFAGIPVVCEDGIAAALYENDLLHPVNPDIRARLQFLQNVAWWQWKPSEAVEAWNFIISILT